MFENFLGNAQLKREQESEARQINLAKETNAMNNTNDQAFIDQSAAKSDLIRWQQDLTESLEVLKHRLKNETFNGKEWVVTRKKVKKQDGTFEMIPMPPLMTEEGLQMVDNQLSPFLGFEAKNLINTNLQEVRILYMLEDTMNTIADNLADNYDIYMIDATPSNLDHVCRLIKNAIIPTPFRAWDGWTKIQDNTGIRRIETFNSTPAQEKQKMFGIF